VSQPNAVEPLAVPRLIRRWHHRREVSKSHPVGADSRYLIRLLAADYSIRSSAMPQASKKMVVGFNHNIKHKGQVYHVQTEDSGVENPHIITHLFVGGNILASRKTSYAAFLSSKDLEKVVRSLMEEQHKEILRKLVGGAFDRAAENGAPVTSGLVATLGSNAAAAHCAGLVKAGSPTALPSLLMHGSLKVGSVIPKPKFSSRRVCFKSSPYFRLWRPCVVETSARTPQFRSCRFSFCVAGVSANGFPLG